MNKRIFFEILNDYAGKLFSLYRFNMQLQNRYTQWMVWDLEYNFLNPKWALAMEEGLAKLKTKMDDK